MPGAREIAARYGLRVTRIHTHIGSGADSAVWVRVAAMSLAMLEHFPEADTLDLGGGFKVARMPDEVSADMRAIGSAVREEFLKFEATTGRRIALEIEPGTFLAANSTCLMARVEEVVDTGADGYTFVKTSTGMTEITRPSLYGAQHPIRVLAAEGSPVRPVVVVGHCCESGDILTPAKGDPEGILPRELPVPRPGDILLVGGAGSYCSGMSTKHYNSFPEAGELLLREDGSIAVMRERQAPEQVWSNERDVAL